jgi:hypothetical protein
MNKNKGDAGNIAGFINLELELTMPNLTRNQNVFQYHCSFCACELVSDSVRFNGVGACPACNDLAHLWVDSLRGYEANYKNNLGVKR